MQFLAGKSLFRHMSEWAKTQTDNVAVAVREISQVPETDIPILLDQNIGAGPISALASGVDFALTRGLTHVLLVGCDQPFLPRNLLKVLVKVIGHSGAAMPISAGQDQPMATLWRADADAIERYLMDGGRSLWRFASQIGVSHVRWPNSAIHDAFLNINDEAALLQAEQRVRNRT